MNQEAFVLDVPTFSFGSTAIIRPLPGGNVEPVLSTDLLFEELLKSSPANDADSSAEDSSETKKSISNKKG